MSAIKIAVIASCLALVSPSAIPMWEFLSRGEKMSHLFNMFVKQVAEHCDNSDMPDCQKVLLVYGLTNLAKMEDDSLDKMDPYQRGANDIIWESMMHGSYKKKEKHEEHRDYYADAMEPSTSEGNSLGSHEEASTNVEKFTPSSRYIVGPMVVRVLPDGSPVPRDDPLPRDEDAEEFLAMRSKPVPSLDELATNKHYHQRPSQRQTAQHQPTHEPTTVAPSHSANTEFLSLRDLSDIDVLPARQFASLHHEVVATRRDSKTSMKRSPKN